MAVLQTSLFDTAAEPALEQLSAGLTRTQLDARSWVDHRFGWVQGSDALFETVAAHAPWRAERRQMYDTVVDVPRLVSWYDAASELPHPVLSEARFRLSAHYRDVLPEGFATAGMCLYRDGRDSVAWHGDTIGRGRTEDTLVAIVSIGAPRALLLRPRGGGTSARFMLGHGDLLVMGGACQREWEHAIPKTAKPCGPRISIQFRPPGVR
jgi:alkylated DNA repair dioxygenase AlkB